MSLILKGLPQVSQDGKYLWFTDKSGVYATPDNEGGWGTPNFERDESALLSFVFRKTDPRQLLDNVSSLIAYSAGFGNDVESAFQTDYRLDGYHQFYMVRLMVSGNDTESLDGTPVSFVDDDIWYNTLDFQIKRRVLGLPVVLDLTNQDDLDIIIADEGRNSVVLLCEDMFYKDLAVEKNNKYTQMRQARREENSKQVDRLRKDQVDIGLGTATAAYQFSFGLKIEAQDTIETLLDDFKL